MNPLRWLFLDLNAYFASVEQQENPALRGKPVVVVPLMADTTCCIAASYEAKAFGIKTGTRVGEAKAMCPGLILVEARHGPYIRYHQAIVAAVESCIPVHAELSIDEMICELWGSQREVSAAVELSKKIKETIIRDVGPCLRSSIGLAPNRFLSKVGSDMQKPDGLTVIRKSDLPQLLYRLKTRDLPGIGARMERRLLDRGITTMEHLCSLDKVQMRHLWGGVVGERFWSWLQGDETDEILTHRRSVGHSHVLPPDERTRTAAFAVAKKLVSKAAFRLRRMEYWAAGMSLVVRYAQNDEVVQRHTKLPEVQDTPTFLKSLTQLWEYVPPGNPFQVGVTFFPLVPKQTHIPSLFENPKREQLSLTMDKINAKYGRDTAYFGTLFDTHEKAPTRIAFTQIPDISEVD